MRGSRVLVAALAAGTLVAGCAHDRGTGSGTTGRLSGPVTVFAAASLTESFTILGRRFEATHPGVTVRFNFAASSALAQGIGQGAPADVYASASTKTMDAVVRSGNAADPRTFARNVMQVAVPPDNPGRVTGVADLGRPEVKTAVCEEQVPCGAAARQVFDNVGVSVRPVTLAPDVKAVLTAVQLGEVDAGMVYVTDVLAAGGKVRGVELPPAQNASTSYPIAVLTRAPNAAAARAFVDYMLSAAGTTVLTDAGFTRP